MLPTEISFTLEGERITGPLPDETPAQAAQAPRFGAEYSGTFRVKRPTIGEDMRISAAVTAYFERLGVNDPTNAPMAYFMQLAFALFEVVGKDEPPPWFSREAPATGETKLAIAAVYRVAQTKLVDEKKSAGNTPGS